MSFYPSELIYEKIRTNKNIKKADEIHVIADLTALNALPESEKATDRLYFVESENVYYRWSGVSFFQTTSNTNDVVLSASNVGTGEGIYKEEVSNDLRFKTLKGSNNVTITNNTNDLTMDTVQAITTTATPTFANVISNDATANNHVVTKLQMDNALSNKVSTTSSTNTNIIEPIISSGNLALTAKVGAHQPVLYRLETTQGANNISTNNNGDFTLVTQMSIGLLGLNQSTSFTFMQHLLNNIQQHGLPMRLRLSNSVNVNEYAEFILHTSNGSTGVAYQFFVTFDAVNSTVTTWASTTFIFAHFIQKTRTIQAGAGITVTESSNKEILTIASTSTGEANTASNVGSGAGIFRDKLGVNLNLKSIIAGSGVTINNNADDITINASSLSYTAGNGIVISGSTISSDLTLFLNGTVVISNLGVITLNGVPQTGSPYSLNGSILTIRCDVLIDNSFTMNPNSSLIIEGDLTVLGNINIGTLSNLGVRGNIHFRGKDNTSTLSCNSCSIISFDEFSVRNYTKTDGILNFQQTAGPLTIDAKSITFDSNNSLILFNNGSFTHTLIANTIDFSNNFFSTTAPGFNTIDMYKMRLTASIIRFTKNKCTGNYCIIFRDSEIITANILEFRENECLNPVADSASDVVFFGGNNSLIGGDKINFIKNRNNSILNSQNNSVINFFPPCTISANTITFDQNDSGNVAAWSINLEGSAPSNYVLIKCNLLELNLVSGPGYFCTVRNANTDTSNFQGLYDTRRIPKVLLTNVGTNYVGGWIKSSYLGFQPIFETYFADYTTPTVITLTTAGTHYKLIPASVTNLTNNISVLSGDQFAAGAVAGSIQYIGEETTLFEIHADLVLEVSNDGADYSMILLVNDVNTAIHSNRTKHAQANRPESWDLSKIIQLNKNDTISLWFSNLTQNNRTVDINLYQFSIKKLVIM